MIFFLTENAQNSLHLRKNTHAIIVSKYRVNPINSIMGLHYGKKKANGNIREKLMTDEFTHKYTHASLLHTLIIV